MTPTAKRRLFAKLWRHYRSCYWCGREMTLQQGEQPQGTDATLDHRKPLREGGNDNDKNIVLACFECNNRRRRKLWQKRTKPKKVNRSIANAD